MAGFLDPTKKAKENLLNKVRNERAQRKLEKVKSIKNSMMIMILFNALNVTKKKKKKEEASYIIQDWWRGVSQRKAFIKDLRSESDKCNRMIAAHCKQKQTQISSPKSSLSECKNNNDNDEIKEPLIINRCFNMIKKFNLYYNSSMEQDRNRLTIIIANTLKLLNLNDPKNNNYISYGFSYCDINKKQLFYIQMSRLWQNVNKTLNYYHERYDDESTTKSLKKTMTTHIKILVNFLISFMDFTKWRIMNGEYDEKEDEEYKSIIKLIKKNHPSFIKKYICNKPKLFYKEWKKIIIFCQDLGLKLIATNCLYTTVIPSKLSSDLLKEFAQQILSIPYLASNYRDMFIIENKKTNKIELSLIWQKCLPLFADNNNKKIIKINGKCKGIPNCAWFVSNCSCLIKSAESMNNKQFEQFVSFFSDLITQYSVQLAFNDDQVDEKDLNEYQTGFGYLYDSDIISKLFWSIFDQQQLLDTTKLAKTYRTKVEEPLPSNIKKAVETAVKTNKNIQARFEFIHHLIITLHSVKDVKLCHKQKKMLYLILSILKHINNYI